MSKNAIIYTVGLAGVAALAWWLLRPATSEETSDRPTDIPVRQPTRAQSFTPQAQRSILEAGLMQAVLSRGRITPQGGQG